ncbi:MAG: 4-hydroxythreonine-4-phosphate dehydrogenase PdxA [Bacteroidetes bacterium]|nr:MAG: 4-hydroxythreonine-4-phosphate dehydrogenase PdxA [Bacteroidota bacterium]
MKKNHQNNLRVGITIGDVNGVGPEIILKAFLDSRLREMCIPILYGSSRVMNIYRKVLKINKFQYNICRTPSQAQPRKLNIIECIPKLERVDIGQPSELGGKAAYLAVKRAVEDAMHKELDALVTMPVDKASFQLHDADFQGHTELLAKAFGVEENLMMMVSEQMKVGLVTNHLPLAEVARNLSENRIASKIRLMHECLRNDFNILKPNIAVLGLNPHAGDKGLLGNEDEEIIKPAVNKMREAGMLVTGPYPADGFFGNLTYRRFDGIIAMYHDQGLIPFKLISGFEGVNYTAGMPFIRTSPDHGVAYDIAGKNLADPESFRLALYLALDIHRNRSENEELKQNALSEVAVNTELPETELPEEEEENTELETE